MSKPKSLHVAEIMDWLLELVPVWEVPVTVSMLHAAHPVYSSPTYANALKQLTMNGVLYTTTGTHDRVFYFPVEKREPCLIQEYLCGRLT